MNEVGMIKQNWILKETYENIKWNNLSRNVDGKVFFKLAVPNKLINQIKKKQYTS